MKECQNIEFKETWSDDYLKWICGFANAQGGKLYIGVDDSENIVGIKNARLAEPKIEDADGGVRIMIFRKGFVAQGVAQGVAQEWTDIQKQILELIQNNPKISRAEIAEQIGKSVKTIERRLADMEQIVKYVGSGYSGHWEINTAINNKRQNNSGEI